MNLGGPEIVILLAVVLLLFGSSKVPQLARSLGSAKREFETAQKDGSDATPTEIPEAAPAA
ncbi:MAG: twin-arginine translocase TatA/TatE family subunit [Acidimicrobiales bacterium]|nr:twin-arginine translocase TatA/TatE family subunit [Acidimicrobiales bacterium]